VGLGLLHVDEGRRGGWWTGAGEAVGRDRGLVWSFGLTYQPDQARSNRVERILGNASAAGAVPAAMALGAKRQIKGLGRILKPAKEQRGSAQGGAAASEHRNRVYPCRLQLAGHRQGGEQGHQAGLLHRGRPRRLMWTVTRGFGKALLAPG
jgi:hypothetical protein